MNGALLLLLSILVLAAGYLVYGRFLARYLKLDNSRPMPSTTRADGVDFVPARTPVLLGHHFASIAGASPIVGPVLAAVFGWLPVWLWILIGGVFMGAVHDFVSLVASVRHRGESIGVLIERYMGRKGKLLFLLFCWLTLLLVIAVFTILVSRTFVAEPASASASLLFILLAVVFGLLQRLTRFGLGTLTLIGVALLFALMAAGQHWPLDLTPLLGQAGTIALWRWVLLGYVFVASVTPVHMLLQPRDYLNSFLLYAMMLAGIVGIFVQAPVIQLPAFTSFYSDKLGGLFPMLFVTVACGAISGFHSLVSSGTSARQLRREGDALPVGFGSMLIESLLAIIALVAVASTMNASECAAVPGGEAVAVFARGMAAFTQGLGIPAATGITFFSLAISAFALTSLDTATRLGRFLFEELALTIRPASTLARNRYLATLVTVAGAACLLFSPAGLSIWPIFGAANQLLAALALLTLSVWLSHESKRRSFVVLPMLFMFLVTVSSLVLLVIHNTRSANWLLVFLSAALLVLALVLIAMAIGTVREARKQIHSTR